MSSSRCARLLTLSALLAALTLSVAGCASRARVIQVAPPAVRGEVRPPRPGPDYVWVPGRWEWRDDRHAWIPGVWIPAKPGKIWIPGHWRRLGVGWIWQRGRWAPA